MTEETSRTIANAILGVAVIAAAYVVIRTPSLRRVAWGLGVTALTVTLPAWFRQEVQTAWAESGQRVTDARPVAHAGPTS